MKRKSCKENKEKILFFVTNNSTMTWFSNKSPLTLFILLLAYVGILYELYNETDEYLLYPIYSRANIVPVRTRLPAITFCYAIWYSEHYDKITSLKVIDASKLAPDLNDTLLECKLTLPNGTIVDCLSITTVHKYMHSRFFCYSMFEENRTSLPDDQLMYDQKIRIKNNIHSPFIKIKHKPPYKKNKHWVLTVRGYNKPLTLIRATESKVWLEPEINSKVVLNYKVVQRFELPKPYPGECYNYDKRFNSIKALTTCWLDDYYHPKYNKSFWPDWTLYDYEGEYTDHEKSLTFEPRNLPNDVFRKVNEKCFEKFYVTDCKRSYIILYKISSKKTPKLSTFTTTIPWTPANKMVIESVPKLDLIEFLTQIGGIFSMWIGVSMYITINRIICSNCKFLQKKSNQIGNIIKISRPTIQIPRYYYHNQINISTGNKFFSTNTCDDEFCAKLNKTITFIIKSFSLLITLYFVMEIISIYFDAPFYVYLVSMLPETIRIPRLTVCLDMIIFPEKMKKFFPQIHDSIPPNKWIDELTIEQLFKVTLDWDEIYSNTSTFISPLGKREKIDLYFNFTKSLTGRYVCFSTFSQKEFKLPKPIEPLKRAQVLYLMSFDVRLITANLLKLKQKKLRTYLHENEDIEEDLGAPHRLSIIVDQQDRDTNSYLMRISSFVNILYPGHMKSTCLDYRKQFNFSSRKSVVDRCVETKFVKKYKRWPMSHQCEKKLPIKFNNQSLMKEQKEIEQQCDKIFNKVDCVRTHINAILQDEFWKPQFTSLILYPPSKQFYEYRQELVNTVIDIFGYTGGTINAWIGLSFLDIELVVILLNKYLTRFYHSLEGKMKNERQISTSS